MCFGAKNGSTKLAYFSIIALLRQYLDLGEFALCDYQPFNNY